VDHPHAGACSTGYTSPPWAALCEAVAKLRVELREETAVMPLRAEERGDGVETESANGGA
jgi:hypothetical protein